MTFAEFKASDPARAMFRKMGLLEYLESAESWRMLRALMVDFNGCDAGRFVALARDCDGVASSGERILLHAILYVTDFAWLADELSGVSRHDGRPYGVPMDIMIVWGTDEEAIAKALGVDPANPGPVTVHDERGAP